MLINIKSIKSFNTKVTTKSYKYRFFSIFS